MPCLLEVSRSLPVICPPSETLRRQAAQELFYLSTFICPKFGFRSTVCDRQLYRRQQARSSEIDENGLQTPASGSRAAAESNHLHEISVTPGREGGGAKVAAEWLFQIGLLGQYSLASKQLYG